MAHAVMIPSAVMAKNVDSLVRSIKSASALDNGNIVNLGAISSTDGEGEVWVASTPTAATPTGVWMVGEPEVVMTDAKYKGIDPDPRNFFVPAGDVATAFKVKKYDIVRLTDDAFSNTRTNHGFANVQATGELLWATTESAATLFKLAEVTTLAIGGGYPGAGRVTAYRLEAITE